MTSDYGNRTAVPLSDERAASTDVRTAACLSHFGQFLRQNCNLATKLKISRINHGLLCTDCTDRAVKLALNNREPTYSSSICMLRLEVKNKYCPACPGESHLPQRPTYNNSSFTAVYPVYHHHGYRAGHQRF